MADMAPALFLVGCGKSAFYFSHVSRNTDNAFEHSLELSSEMPPHNNIQLYLLILQVTCFVKVYRNR